MTDQTPEVRLIGEDGNEVQLPARIEGEYQIAVQTPKALAVVAQGTWCRECRFFEELDWSEDGERCLACGCPSSNHRVAEVVIHG